jgi:crotonobetainyl-CoA:carnitine CoA-transferase CaiB-like acyl-CoA transferase
VKREDLAEHQGPLAGIRVVDLTMNLSGPYGTMVLAQQGADVIKVERPPEGDILRRVGTGRGGVAAYFVNTNWGKRSVALDLNDPEHKEVLAKLIATADVVVENFRPTVMPGLGFAPEELVAKHPRLIYAAMRGFPSDSRLADAPAYDHIIQAMAGFGANQADLKTGVPVLVQQALVDKVTGLTAAQAVTAALFERERTGKGQLLEISMLHAGVAFLWPDVSTNVTLEGEFDKLPANSRTFRLSKTADGHIALVSVTTPQWEGLLRACGRDELIGHPDLATPQLRGRNAAGVMKEIGLFLETLPTAEVVERLSANGVPCGQVSSLEAMPALVESISPGFLVHEEHPQLGPMIHPKPAVQFTTNPEIRPAPAMGEHTDEILAELDC